jgi:methylenetetrahydrofolate reductase (NADPH)
MNRSPATRAILSTLKLWRPWDPEHTGLGEPRRPAAAA